jgi:hypothetical protein
MNSMRNLIIAGDITKDVIKDAERETTQDIKKAPWKE